MGKSSEDSDESFEWANKWLDSVVEGSSTMSQRKLESIEEMGGGIRAVRRLARSKGVHLVLLTDDKGSELIVASTAPFKVIC